MSVYSAYLDCSGLHDIQLRVADNRITLDGSYFIEDLKRVLEEFSNDINYDKNNEEANKKAFKQKLILALASNPDMMSWRGESSRKMNLEDFAERINDAVEILMKKLKL